MREFLSSAKALKDLNKTFKEFKTDIMGSKSEREKHADTIIRNHMAWSMGAGLIPFPVADFFAVSAVQLDMVRQLCKLYEIDFKENEMKAVITALTTSGFAKVGAKAMIKFIPGIGQIVGGMTMAVLSGASSYAVGEVFKKHFETGGTILDFDMDRLKKMYNEKFEKGKKMAEQMKQEIAEELKKEEKANGDSFTVKGQPSSDPVEKLKELAQLKKDGLISDDEYETMKKKVING